MPAAIPSPDSLVDVRDLCVDFRGMGASLRAVDGLSFVLGAGEVLGVVGESGSGKTVASLAMMGLLDRREADVTAGHFRLMGREIRPMDESTLRPLRGRDIAMIFQDPMSALSPYQRVRAQMEEVLLEHGDLGASERRDRCIRGLIEVGITDPEEVMERYAHQLSGGQCQRVLIATALLCDPRVLIADEPTTALDVTVQAVILRRLGELARDRNMGVLLITHDLAVVAGIADRVLVMYAGKAVETAPVQELFERPAHPYTRALLGCIPRMDGPIAASLRPLAGRPPSLDEIPSGCAFHPRCERAESRCALEAPEPVALGPGHSGWCHFAQESSRTGEERP